MASACKSGKTPIFNKSTHFFDNDKKGRPKKHKERIFKIEYLELKNKVYTALGRKLRDAIYNFDKPLQEKLEIDMQEIILNLEDKTIGKVLNKMCKKYNIGAVK